MSSNLTITTQYTEFQMTVTATITPGGTLPLDIFIYENTGGTTLGKYIGVCNLDEYRRLQTFTGVATPIFGNKFVKWTSAYVVLPCDTPPTDTINCITNGVKALSLEFANATPVVTNISIP